MEVQFTGLQEILQSLGNLALEEEEENKALNAAAKIVKNAVIEEAPSDDGTLKENIKANRAKDGEVPIHTGGAYHAHIVENGRSGGSKEAKKNGKQQKVTWGPTAPNPFFTRGFEKSKDEAMQAMIDVIKKEKNL